MTFGWPCPEVTLTLSDLDLEGHQVRDWVKHVSFSPITEVVASRHQGRELCPRDSCRQHSICDETLDDLDLGMTLTSKWPSHWEKVTRSLIESNIYCWALDPEVNLDLQWPWPPNDLDSGKMSLGTRLSQIYIAEPITAVAASRPWNNRVLFTRWPWPPNDLDNGKRCTGLSQAYIAEPYNSGCRIKTINSYLSSSPHILGAARSRLGVHSMLHIYPLCCVFYLPWHRTPDTRRLQSISLCDRTRIGYSIPPTYARGHILAQSFSTPWGVSIQECCPGAHKPMLPYRVIELATSRTPGSVQETHVDIIVTDWSVLLPWADLDPVVTLTLK